MRAHHSPLTTSYSNHELKINCRELAVNQPVSWPLWIRVNHWWVDEWRPFNIQLSPFLIHKNNWASVSIINKSWAAICLYCLYLPFCSCQPLFAMINHSSPPLTAPKVRAQDESVQDESWNWTPRRQRPGIGVGDEVAGEDPGDAREHPRAGLQVLSDAINLRRRITYILISTQVLKLFEYPKESQRTHLRPQM